MLNIEKFRDKLIELGVINPSGLAKVKVRGKDKLVACEWTDCVDCEYYKDSECSSKAEEWLFAEYKEPEVDWSKVKVDTPILVRNSKDGSWNRRYFAGYENGKVYAWKYGRTSWTAMNGSSWEYAKLVESEETEDE